MGIPVRNRDGYAVFSSGGYGVDEEGFSAFLGHFSRSLRVVWSGAPVFGALGGEEFFATEGSCTVSFSALVDIDIPP